MDTSKEYIMMCEKAGEIQERWKWKDGDYIYCPGLQKTIIYNFVYTNSVEMGNFIVWLPRQDQLQGMMGDVPAQALLGMLFFSVDGFNEEYWNQFTSMEQLWLAFVMKEKYQKI